MQILFYMAPLRKSICISKLYKAQSSWHVSCRHKFLSVQFTHTSNSSTGFPLNTALISKQSASLSVLFNPLCLLTYTQPSMLIPLAVSRCPTPICSPFYSSAFQVEFHLNLFIVSASGGRKPHFLANFDLWGLLYRPLLLPMRVKFGVLKQTERLHVHAKFHMNVFIVSASGGQKPQLASVSQALKSGTSTAFQMYTYCPLSSKNPSFPAGLPIPSAPSFSRLRFSVR